MAAMAAMIKKIAAHLRNIMMCSLSVNSGIAVAENNQSCELVDDRKRMIHWECTIPIHIRRLRAAIEIGETGLFWFPR